jgi:hypothetical protein
VQRQGNLLHVVHRNLLLRGHASSADRGKDQQSNEAAADQQASAEHTEDDKQHVAPATPATAGRAHRLRRSEGNCDRSAARCTRASLSAELIRHDGLLATMGARKLNGHRFLLTGLFAGGVQIFGMWFGMEVRM